MPGFEDEELRRRAARAEFDAKRATRMTCVTFLALKKSEKGESLKLVREAK